MVLPRLQVMQAGQGIISRISTQLGDEIIRQKPKFERRDIRFDRWAKGW